MARPATSAVGLFSGRPGTASIKLLSGTREPVRLCALANVDIATGGLVTCDSVTPVAGNGILLPNQTDPTENGIYTAAAGPWYRRTDSRSPRAITKGVEVKVQEGNTKALSLWEFRTTNPVIGTDAISIIELVTVASSNRGFGVFDMLTIGGSANDLTATFNPAYTAHAIGQRLRIRPTLPNSGPMTLLPDGFAVIPMKMPDGSPIPSGTILAGVDYILRDDGTNFLIESSNVTF